MALGLFRTMAAISRDIIIANTFGSAAILLIFLLGGFIVPKGVSSWFTWPCKSSSFSLSFFLMKQFLFPQIWSNHGGSGPFGCRHYPMDSVQFLLMSLVLKDGGRYVWYWVITFCIVEMEKMFITKSSVAELVNLTWRVIWQRPVGNSNLGNIVLQSHGLPTADYWYWLGVGALLLYALFFNIIVILALTFLNRKSKFYIGYALCS